MTPPRPPIKLITHFEGPVSVDPPDPEVEVVVTRGSTRPPAPGKTEPELTQPDFRKAPALEPVVIEDDEAAGRPLLLAAHGRGVGLTGEAKRIRAAHRAGRAVEVHVFADPEDVR